MEMLPEYQWVLEQLDSHRISSELRHWILRAYNDHEWDWRQSDGCTGVCEIGVPRDENGKPKYKSIPCVFHDWLRNRMVKTGKMKVGVCDKLFKRAMQEFGWHPLITNVRWFAVRWIAWPLWFKWKQSGTT
jgi:hypothetical protein